jgi:hypothetical protein
MSARGTNPSTSISQEPSQPLSVPVWKVRNSLMNRLDDLDRAAACLLASLQIQDPVKRRTLMTLRKRT